MLISVSNKVIGTGAHFSTHLPTCLEILQPHSIVLEGVHVDPWPEDAFFVVLNICEPQIVNDGYLNVLGLVTSQEFSSPKVDALYGYHNFLECKLVRTDGKLFEIDTCVIQFSVTKKQRDID